MLNLTELMDIGCAPYRDRFGRLDVPVRQTHCGNPPMAG